MALQKKILFPIDEEDNAAPVLTAHARFLARKKSEKEEKEKGVSAAAVGSHKSEPKSLNIDHISKNFSSSTVLDSKICTTDSETSFEKAFENLKRSKFFKEPETLSLEIRKLEDLSNDKTKNNNLINKISKTRSCILVSSSQRGNSILKFIRNVPIQYEDMVPDYLINETTCAIFLSLRFHLLNPNYIHEKLKKLGHQFLLRILLLQVDAKDPHHSIKELTKIAILADCTLLLAWSAEEAGRYLEIYKVFEKKPPDLLMEKQESSTVGKLVNALTSVKSVNKTDAKTLLTTFKSFKNIVQADKDYLALCPGIGPQKVSQLYDTIHEPFLKKQKISEK